MNTKEGWTWLINSPKWHYFTSDDNKSLCGRYMLLGLGDLQPGQNNNPDNCKACQKKLAKRKSATVPTAALKGEAK